MIYSEETALLVIDVQNDFCAPEGTMSKAGNNLSNIETTIPNILQCVDYFHKEGIKPIFVKTHHSQLTDSKEWKSRVYNNLNRNCISDWGRQFYKVQPQESDPVIIKNRYSAFVGTNLDLILRSNEIKNIILVGFTTNVCVEGTARDGFMKNYNVITLSDCTDSYNDHEHESGLFNLDKYFGSVMDFESVIKTINKIS